MLSKSRLVLEGSASDPASSFKSEPPAVGSSSSGQGTPTKFQKISLKSGWLGDPETYEVAPYEKHQGWKSKAIWRPDEPTTTGWQAYLKS